MLPIILFAVRYGCGWGAGAGFVYGIRDRISSATSFSIDWTTIICDYFLAFTAAGLWRRPAGPPEELERATHGTVIGGVLRFLAHYIIGAVVWGKYMPDKFFGMTMTSPWFYSLLYNGSYMLPQHHPVPGGLCGAVQAPEEVFHGGGPEAGSVMAG